MAATKLLYLRDAHLVPVILAAILVLAAHTLGHHSVLTTGRVVGDTTVPSAIAAVLRTTGTVLTFTALPVPTIESHAAAITAPVGIHKPDAHIVPFRLTAIDVHFAHTSGNVGVLTAGRSVGLATRTVARPAIDRAIAAMLITLNTDAVAARGHHISAIAAVKLFHRRHAHIIPLSLAAVRVQRTDAFGYCQRRAPRGLVLHATTTGAVTTIVGTVGAVLVIRAL